MIPNDVTIERPAVASGAFSLLSHMRVEPGSNADWEELHELHYKAEGTPIGPKYYRCVLDYDGTRMLAGVVILSVPKLLLEPRHRMFPKLKPGHDTKLTNVYRAKFINQHFKVNSRSVVDTLFRSVGVSYRLLNLAARMSGTTNVEIQSSMSKFNPFAMRAGFVFAQPRTPPCHDKALALFRRHFRAHPSDQESILEELASFSKPIADKALRELKEFYYKNSSLEKTGSNLNAGTSKVDAMSARDLLKNLQQLAFSSPMYGVYRNPDAGRVLPSSLPLSAFDRQPTNQPLILEGLE